METTSVLGLLRRRWIPLLLCLLTGIGVALAVTAQTTPLYRASTSLIINIPEARTSQEALQGVQLSTQLLKSYAAIATSRTAAQAVAEDLGLDEPAGTIRAKLTATPEPDTLLITIAATDADPSRARRLADSAATVFIQSVKELEQNKNAKVEPRVVDPAASVGAPISPRPSVNLAGGLFIGTAVGLAVALLLDALDRTVKTAAQVEAALKAPLLASIPRGESNEDAAGLMARHPHDAASEAYRGLRTALRFVRPDDPLRSVLITSSSQGEGKTTTATNLAIALAQAGERVILVDGDLRRGRVMDALGLPGGPGLTSVIMQQVSLEDALQSWGGILHVLGTGPVPPNPAEILGSESMARVLEDLEAMADVVVIDATPILPVTDAVLLSAQVDGVLLVARAGQTERSRAQAAQRRLEGVNANVVGAVLNGVAPAAASYYVGYGYVAPASPNPEGDPSERSAPRSR